jgi:tetratricopeptide (TPR) repeat protein
MIKANNRSRAGILDLAIVIAMTMVITMPTACSAPEKEAEYILTPAQERIEEGKGYLAQNRYFDAYDSFDAALTLDEGNEQARFGQALSRTGELVDNVQAMIALALVVVKDLPIRGDLPSLSYVDENEYIISLIEDILNLFVDPTEEIMEICGELQGSAGFKFKIDSFEIHAFSYPFMDLSGEWDRADVLGLQAGIGMFGALFQVLTSYSLSMDLYDIYDMALVMFDQDTFNTPNVLNLVAQLLTDEQYPNFLGLVEEDADGDGVADGLQNQQRAADYLQQAFEALVAVPQIIEAESDDQADDILVSSSELSSWASAQIGLSGRMALLDGKFIILSDDAVYDDIFVGLSDLGLAALAKMADNLAPDLADETRPRVTMEDLLEVIIEVAISLLPYIDLGSLSEIIEPYMSMLNDPTMVVRLATTFIPADIELDIGDFLRDPAGFNTILPPVRTDLDPDKMSLALEFECTQWIPLYAEIGSVDYLPERTAFCPRYDEDEETTYSEEDFAMIDESHFTADFYSDLQIDAIDEDGVTSIMPIIPFQDPSMARLLWINGSDMDIESADGMAPADNLTLNAFIALAVGQFLN